MVLRAPIVVHALWFCVLVVLLKAASTRSQGCPAGFTGTNCTTDIDDCDNNNCSGNGNCSDRVAGYFCQCNEGFYGINCEINTGPCSPNPCGNNGTCSVEESLIQCSCTPDYEGQRCETESASTKLALDSWIIVTIVASIILLMLLFIIIILAYKYRQEKRIGKENFYFNGIWEMENMGPTRTNYTNAIYANTYTGGQANGSGLYANGNHEYANGSSGYANGKNPSRRDDEVVNEAYL